MQVRYTALIFASLDHNVECIRVVQCEVVRIAAGANVVASDKACTCILSRSCVSSSVLFAASCVPHSGEETLLCIWRYRQVTRGRELPPDPCVDVNKAAMGCGREMVCRSDGEGGSRVRLQLSHF